MKPIAFVPLRVAELTRLAEDGELAGPLRAYAATPRLNEFFGYGPEAAEDADYAAQLFASLRCVLDRHDRLVLAVHTRPARRPERTRSAARSEHSQWAAGESVEIRGAGSEQRSTGNGTGPGAGEADFGAVNLPGVRWGDAQAVFIDEPEARAAFRAYASHCEHSDLSALWDDPRIEELLLATDLLWFAPREYRVVIDQLGG